MDMGRTCVNVIGNCLATVVVARWEGEFDDARARVFGTPAEAALYLKSGEVLSPMQWLRVTEQQENIRLQS